MSLREEMRKYEQITGESAENVPIIKLGAFLDGYEMGIKALEQTSWIPVSERLPEESGDYLVTTKWKGRYSGNVYVETNMAEYRRKTKEWDCVDVIAWMFLPQAYTESEVEK